MRFHLSTGVLALASALALSAAACASGSPGSSGRARASTTSTTSAEMDGLSDAQIASVVSVEVAADLRRGQYAQAEGVARDVRRLADDQARDDSTASLRLGALLSQKSIDPAANALADRLSSDSDAHAVELRKQSGLAFDRAFLIAEARSEQRFLDVIDAALAPSTHDPDLRRMLADVRARALSHRNEATRLLSAPSQP